ncbi:MAG: secretion protein [Candidatus Diapherotrites archaeon CG10_big_fil_rev_8_21_14_0_10_31_34]|nr:MAG: secretion protein [Candidatus Diapherotrites archaeon CG10_big_fil_rev_8_21_14_0_10_31_34]
MADYLKDLVKKAKRIKTEEEAVKPKPKEITVDTEELRKKLILEKRQKEKLRKQSLEDELRQKVPPKKEIEEETENPEEKEKRDVSKVEKELESLEKKEIDSYGEVKIYKVSGKSLPYYVIPVTKPTLGERTVINTIKEAATRLISIAPYRIRDPEQRRTVYKQRIIEILQASTELNIPERRFNFYAESVVREMVGYGLIDPLIRDDKLEEIMVIGPKKPVYVFHRQYEMMMTNIEFFGDNEIEDLINKIGREVGRRVDISTPLLDARLADGSRVNATIPPASISGSSLTIRKFRADPYSIVDLINYGSFDTKSAAFLWLCVEGLGVKPANILITGGTGSGKTTTLNVLASFIPERERIVTIEDTAELHLPLEHIISLESRPPGLEGTGEITIDILTKNSLRMRPDRVIVGEVRHDEAFTLFTAMNTGHDGMVVGKTLIQLSEGNKIKIEEIAKKAFNGRTTKKEKDYETIELKEKIMVPSFNKNTLKIEEKKITHVFKRKKKQKIMKIKLLNGKELHLTKDHPIYRIENGIKEINSEQARKEDCILVKPETNHNYLSNLIQGQTTNQIQILVESDLRFEKIVSVEEEEFGGWMYDLTVEDNHNYIANGVIISNCLGTIHANSPQETLVRVTSPPMNVPEVMLSGLDLIVVEHRIHDKKKGTIRRITEIAEVTGVLENKTSTQTLFERDALRDKLTRSNAESSYVKNLMKFTGYNAKQIEKELTDRENFLKKLIDKKIHNMDEVAEAMRDFLNRRT